MGVLAWCSMDVRDVDGLVGANDRLLAPLILATSEEERSGALGKILVERARPLVHRVVARYRQSNRLLGAEEAEDIASHVVLQLVRRLQAVAFEHDQAIERLDDFTATLTFNALYDFMRRCFPERTRLKNRVRYVLAHDARFRMWTAPQGMACAAATAEPLDPVAHAETAILDAWYGLAPERLGDALEHILGSVGRPLLINDLLDILADLWNIRDAPAGAESSEAVEVAPAAVGSHESYLYLQDLWSEIRSLRGPQRAALLLNLRDADGSNAVSLFMLIGIVSIDAVADAIGLPVARIAGLWDRLPLDDRTIASLLGVTRQQVINLRKSARERLARRMKQRGTAKGSSS